jgi:hypothetical protein
MNSFQQSGYQQPQQPRNPVWLATATIIALLLLLIGYMLYLSLTFRVVGTSPKLSNVATASPYIKVSFNRELSSNGLSVSGTDNLIKSTSVDGKILQVNLNNMTTGNEYTIHINSIESTGGKTIQDKDLTFKAKNIDVSKLPKDQQQTLINQQDHNQGVAADPIVEHLPYGTLDFTLTAQTPDTNQDQSKLVLNARLLLSHADMSNEDAAVAQYKKEVTDYIVSLGLNPANYNIQYIVVASD